MIQWLSSQFKKKNFVYAMSFWPPYWGTGIWVTEVSDDLLNIKVVLKKHFWNANIIGTQFGGSLYSMTDPFYMLMLQEALGSKYFVVDRSGHIEYLKKGRGKVEAQFSLNRERVAQIKLALEKAPTHTESFDIPLYCNDQIIARVRKELFIKRSGS